MARTNRKESAMVTESDSNQADTIDDVVATDVVSTETTVAEAAAATPEEPKSDERYKLVTLKDGSVVKRKDYILDRWVNGKKSRGEIAKELTELTGKKVAYQIVFAGTKGVKGGPVAVPEGEATPAPTTP